MTMEEESERCDMKMSQTAIAGFEGRGQRTSTKGCRQPLEAEKGKKMYSPLEPPEQNTTLSTS